MRPASSVAVRSSPMAGRAGATGQRQCQCRPVHLSLFAPHPVGRSEPSTSSELACPMISWSIGDGSHLDGEIAMGPGTDPDGCTTAIIAVGQGTIAGAGRPVRPRG